MMDMGCYLDNWVFHELDEDKIDQAKVPLNEPKCYARSCFEKLQFGASTSALSRSCFKRFWVSGDVETISTLSPVRPCFCF